MENIISIEFSFTGNDSDEHKIDLYDIGHSLIGLQRSLALTTHLILNNEVITQSPSLRNANIYSLPSYEGSWKMKVAVAVGGTIGAALVAPQNSALGHITFSAYDYVISQSLGVNVDYNKSLGKLYEEHKVKNLKTTYQHQLDSVIEKCGESIQMMHRPIFKTKTAEKANISAIIGNEKKELSTNLSMDTYLYLKEEELDIKVFSVTGIITSYNSNTYRGRIYIPELGRPIPFDLDDELRRDNEIIKILDSLRSHALSGDRINITCDVQSIRMKSGRLKAYIMKKIWKKSL